MMVWDIAVMCAKCGVDISATNSTNISAAASHATNAVITHAATMATTTTTTNNNNNNNNMEYIYNCNRVTVTLAAFYHMNKCIQPNPWVKLNFFCWILKWHKLDTSYVYFMKTKHVIYWFYYIHRTSYSIILFCFLQICVPFLDFVLVKEDQFLNVSSEKYDLSVKWSIYERTWH